MVSILSKRVMMLLTLIMLIVVVMKLQFLTKTSLLSAIISSNGKHYVRIVQDPMDQQALHRSYDDEQVDDTVNHDDVEERPRRRRRLQVQLANTETNEIGVKGQYIIQLDSTVHDPVGTMTGLIQQYSKTTSTNITSDNRAKIVWSYRQLFKGVTISNADDDFVAFLTKADTVVSIEQDVQYFLDSIHRNDKAATDTATINDDDNYDNVGSVTSSRNRKGNHYMPWSWGLDRIDSTGLLYDNSYHYYFTGDGVTVAVVDTGIRKTHEEFQSEHGAAERVICGYNAFDTDDTFFDTCGTDPIGHGTHIAGIVGGMVSGVAKRVTLLDVTVVRASDGFLCMGSILAGLDYLVSMKKMTSDLPLVVNLSFSGPRRTLFNTCVEHMITTYNIHVIASAGNEHKDACDKSPGSVDTVITVGSTNYDDTVSKFSNYGYCVALFAPGHQITSSYIRSDTDLVTMSGTSMAAAHVTGVVALLLEAFPDAQPTTLADNMIKNGYHNVLSLVEKPSPNVLLHTLDANIHK